MSRVAAIVLAAGRSTRMGAVNKLTTALGGMPLVAHAVRAALGSKACPVVVVTGHEAQAVKEALTGLPITSVHNAAYATGLASSLQTGVAALPADVEGALILLGDMPAVSSSLLDRLIDAFAHFSDPAHPYAAVVPTLGGRWGNPVLLARRLFSPVMQLAGDEGARRLLSRERVLEIAVDDPSIVEDVDTPDALADIARNFPPAL
ncbi:MAG: nucleotidyltransferase family protein [Chelatococcus sp.]|uniref:nucleotidyltransferase family protein n=1 Tax=Chelatococcus sp. TaxID=1953771 RepID=UPI0025C08182|nr:nucleotidyltransferase family protein [Chelatococcus sp.]MBX3536051.1 nucleotidyltransferase family protein [Chelatococcus sp.]